MNYQRESKDDYYLNIAKAVSARSTCLRRRYGAVIVKDDEIISTGYNGAPRGAPNCIDLGYCERDRKNIPHGERYELCEAVHAEANAIISASRRDMIGSTLYLFGQDTDGTLPLFTTPCAMCYRLIINAGISEIVTKDIKGIVNRKEVKHDNRPTQDGESVPDFVLCNLDGMKETRQAMNLTKKQVGDVLGIPEAQINIYECAYAVPKRENYNKLAEFFGWELWP